MPNAPAKRAPRPAPPIPKERRDAIAAELANPFGHAKLRADGHDISLAVRRYKGLRYVVVLFVDGHVNGENLRLDSPIGAKFYPEKSLSMSPRELAEYAKAWGKREARKAAAKFKDRTRHRIAYFPSGRAAVAHLMRTCESIEICDLPVERYRAAGEGEANA